MSKKSRKEKNNSQPQNLLCNMANEKLIERAVEIQDSINEGAVRQVDYLLRDVIIKELEDRGYLVIESLEIMHASELPELPGWGAKKGTKEEDGSTDTKEQKTDEETKEPGIGVKPNGRPDYSQCAAGPDN